MNILDPVFAVVATAEHLLLVDLTSKKVIPLENERTEYYGISWFPGGNELVLSHSGLENAKLSGYSHLTPILSSVGFSHGQHRSESFLSAPHQIICASDGRVVLHQYWQKCHYRSGLEQAGSFPGKKSFQGRVGIVCLFKR